MVTAAGSTVCRDGTVRLRRTDSLLDLGVLVKDGTDLPLEPSDWPGFEPEDGQLDGQSVATNPPRHTCESTGQS